MKGFDIHSWRRSREWIFIAILKRIPSRRLRITLLRHRGARIANNKVDFTYYPYIKLHCV